MSSFRERNDRHRPNFTSPQTGPAAPGREDPHGKRRAPHKRFPAEDLDQWIWGWHACEAALCNPDRPAPKRILATPERAEAIQRLRGADGRPLAVDLKAEIMANGDIAQALPPGAVHQGLAIRTPPLDSADLEAFCLVPQGLLVMLDCVTDPQNVGAIFRAAAAFGAKGVILQDRRAPPLAGALAKAAAGALERLPCAQVTNLSRALDQLAEAGWRAVGLAGDAERDLEAVLSDDPTVLVLGSEGDGLRRLVSERCDVLARIDMPGGFESLNVASAASVALYAASRLMARKGTP